MWSPVVTGGDIAPPLQNSGLGVDLCRLHLHGEVTAEHRQGELNAAIG